jgi:hypothetical protein
MNADHDVTRTVRTWLHEDANEDADRVLNSVLFELDTTPQRRPWWSAWRFFGMNSVARLAIAAVAIVLVSSAGAYLLLSRGGVGGPADSASPVPSGSSRASAVLSPETDAFLGGYYPGRHAVTVDGVAFSFNIETSAQRLEVSGWEPYPETPIGAIHLSKSIQGPQAAEAVLYWARYPHGAYADPCGDLATNNQLASAADVARVVATARGTELVSGPDEVSVGGYRAMRVVVSVRQAVGCGPGFFYAWKAKEMGAMWTETRVGDLIRVWIVDVNGALLFIGGETTTDTYNGQISHEKEATLDRELQRIVDSIRFD